MTQGTCQSPSLGLCSFRSERISWDDAETMRLGLEPMGFKNFFLLIYFWLRWVFVAAHRLSLVAASGGYSSLLCTGFSLWWLLLLLFFSRRAGLSSCGSQALECRLSSCGAWT